ncbi:MAG: Cysteine rich repeat protein [Syntrophorhabdus sp. PtaB.Bin006]|nr:MAG: Cysteine rich repeat protein [Syntrophorhabdus sp. PtaB.Bin006]
MRHGMILVFSIFVIVCCVGTSFAQKGPAQTVMEGCKKDLDTYCRNVTPGEERILACLYAYEDKLSGRCVYALYEAANQLERSVMALKYLANECEGDISSLCANTVPGEGRILKCLEKNEAKVSSRCKQAAKDVGLKGAKKDEKKSEKPAKKTMAPQKGVPAPTK